MFAGAADRDDAAILRAAPTGAAALRFGGFVEQVVHSACPLVAKFILKAVRTSCLPRRRDRLTRPPGLRERADVKPASCSGAGPNIVRTAGVCQRANAAFPGKTELRRAP